MSEDRPDSRAFGAIADELVATGLSFCFQARGRSMLPAIRDGEILHVKAIDVKDVRAGDIVLYRDRSGFKAHRVIRERNNVFTTRGDAGVEPDTAIRGEQIVGKIIAKECSETGRVFLLGGCTARLRFSRSDIHKMASAATGRLVGYLREAILS